MNFYNTIAQRQILLGQIEAAEGELTPELNELLTISDDAVQEGTIRLLGLRETAQTNILGVDAEIARLQEFKKGNQRTIERLENELKSAALRLGGITAGSYRLTTRPSVAVVLSDDFRASQEHGKWKPPTEGYYKPDKTAIRKALEAGWEVPGAVLDKRTNLVIK